MSLVTEFLKKIKKAVPATESAQSVRQNGLDGIQDKYVSRYGTMKSAALAELNSRKPFSYDPDGDALYKYYRDSYSSSGRRAMEDTVGRAAALTGGYANSYAVSAGSNAYNNELEKLGDKLPELYSLAYDRYKDETDSIKYRYELLDRADEQAYSRYRDSLSDKYANADRLYDAYINDRDYNYRKKTDDRDYNYRKSTDDRDYAYTVARDAVADAQWREQFDEDRRRYDTDFAEDKRRYDTDFAEDKRRYDTDFAEDKRRYDTDFAEDKRRYDTDFAEDKRRYDTDFAEDKRRYDLDYAEDKRQYDTTLEEKKRQYNTSLAEDQRQFAVSSANKSSSSKNKSDAESALKDAGYSPSEQKTIMETLEKYKLEYDNSEGNLIARQNAINRALAYLSGLKYTENNDYIFEKVFGFRPDGSETSSSGSSVRKNYIFTV